MSHNTKHLFLLSFMCVLAAGCNSDGTPAVKLPTAPAESLTAPFGLPSSSLKPGFYSIDITTRDVNQLESVEFSQGQQIVIDLAVSNFSNEQTVLQLPDPGYPAFCVRKIGDVDCRWDSRFNKGFPQVIVDMDFDPVEIREFKITYGQLSNDGTALEPGDYEVRGVVGYDPDGDLLGSDWHLFTIL